MTALLQFWLAHRQELATLVGQHVLLVAVSTAVAVAMGVPLGIFAARRPRLAAPLVGVANAVQTIPSLAMFGFLLPVPLVGGVGARAALVVLVLYALLPIVRATIVGIAGVDRSVREAGVAMGMTARQLLRLVELPLALPSIVAGVRVAAVVGVGSATIAAAIGAGGLGQYIYRGLSMVDTTVILAGAIPAALLALLVDGGLLWLERQLSPRGRRRSRRAALTVAAAIAGLLLAGSAAVTGRSSGVIVVGSKNFTEQLVLGEIVAQTIERETGLSVRRQLNLGGTMICDRALLAGEIDVYVEYTGTALTAIFRRPPSTDRDAVMRTVRQLYADSGRTLLPPLGFDNTFAILVRGKDARELGLRTIEDAARVTPRWRAGFGYEFLERPDGYRGLAKAYGLTFRDAAADHGPGAHLSGARVGSGRPDRRRRDGRADHEPRPGPAGGQPALLSALRRRARRAGIRAASIPAGARRAATAGTAHLGSRHARDEPGRRRSASRPGRGCTAFS